MKAFILTTFFFAFAISAAAQWNTSGSNIYNSNSGNVGIGTYSPGSTLHIKSTSPSLALDKTSSSYEALLQFSKAGSTQYYIWTDNEDNDALKVMSTGAGESDASPRMEFPFSNKNIYMAESGGSVGIGTTSPTAKLHLSSSVERETFRIYLAGNSTNYLSLFQGINAAAIDPVGTGKLFLGYDLSTDVYIGGNSNGGKLGIGTSSPQTLLNINHGAGNATVGSAALRIGGTGNYQSLELGIKGNYDGMISTYGNDLHIYAGNWRTAGVNASGNHNISFYTSQSGSDNWNTPKMLLRYDGSLCIGTTDPKGHKLAVAGSAIAEKVIVRLQNEWPDYVFFNDYKLPSLLEIERFINANKHLPEVPSAVEVKENGLSVGEMNAILLKKVEELTLHMIELKKQNDALQSRVNKLEKQ
jgi:hypothetical protein